MSAERDQDETGTTPANGQQHGSSSGAGGSVDQAEKPSKELEHPEPDTPGSRVEDQADQPGLETSEGR